MFDWLLVLWYCKWLRVLKYMKVVQQMMPSPEKGRALSTCLLISIGVNQTADKLLDKFPTPTRLQYPKYCLGVPARFVLLTPKG